MQASALGDDGVQTVRYWLYAPGRGACKWDEFYERGIMGLAWGEVGDLSSYATKQDLKQRMLQIYPEKGSQKNDIHALWQFANEMKPGDVVFVKKTPEVHHGSIIIIIVNDSAFIKKLYRRNDEVRLISLNPQYEDIILNPDDTIEIIGNVIM